jgi:glycosyltransferase involved in cell wall biosynthesis
MTKVCVVVPSGTMVHAEFCMALANMVNVTPDTVELAFVSVKSSNICLSRNRTIDLVREKQADYLLFLDSDMGFPADTLIRLLCAIQTEKCEAVGCNYVMRQPPFRSLVYGLSEKITGIAEVAKLPTGVMLIDMKVFDRLKKPYFRFPYREEAEGVEAAMGGEDYYFCDSVRAAGGRIFMDTDLSLSLTHWGDMGVRWDSNEKGYTMIVNA